MRLLAILVLISSSLIGCTTASPQKLSADTERDLETSRAKPIGVTRYATTRRPARVCPDTDRLTVGCHSLTAGKITVTGADQKGARGTDFYPVKINDQENGFVSVLNWTRLQTEQDRKTALSERVTCDRKGGVDIGMTKIQVLSSCWGKPKSINATTTARGTREQWVYGGSYLYFDETGHLTTIQH